MKTTIWSPIHLEDLKERFVPAYTFKANDELVFIAGQQSVLLYIQAAIDSGAVSINPDRLADFTKADVKRIRG